MAKSKTIAVRVEPAVHQALTEAARADRRSVSTLVAIIIDTWLRRRQPKTEGGPTDDHPDLDGDHLVRR